MRSRMLWRLFPWWIFKAVFSKPLRVTASRFKRVDWFNSADLAFLLALRRGAPPHIIVLAKVSVDNLINPIGNGHLASNRIQRKHVDFVLHHAQTRQVLVPIELNGPTHASKRAHESEKGKNAFFVSAGLTLETIAALRPSFRFICFDRSFVGEMHHRRAVYGYSIEPHVYARRCP